MPSRNLVVVGRVQNVGFRAYAARLAMECGVVGEVWNRLDGGVEINAEHQEEQVLDKFQATLEQGPGEVADVHAQPIEERGWIRFEIVSRR